jgi:hypothetical protein
MYKVIVDFIDLKDGNRKYQVGDIFPYEGTEVSEDRIIELSTSRNRRGKAMIVEVADKVSVEEVIEEEQQVEEPVEKPKKGKKKADVK